MPPPLPAESDAESVAEEIPHAKAESAKAKEEPKDTDMKGGDDDDEEEEEEGDEEAYIVEAIIDHRSDFKDGLMRYDVKWKGYPDEKDRTWEPEDSFEGAREILEEYWSTLPGGKPEAAPVAPKSAKKRGRQSTEAKKPEPKKRSRVSKGGKKSNGALDQDTTPTPLIGYTEVGDDDWKPPTPSENSWDPLVQSIDTVMREGEDGALWGYVIWNHKNEDGRFYRSKAKLTTIYRACPQRMLHFYEKHLVFSNPETGLPVESAAE